MSEKRGHMLIVDLEATCWRGYPPKGMFNEIIEIGVVVVDNNTKEIINKKSIIVKPEYSEISDFCTELTTLTPEFVNEHGVSFKRACSILRDEFKSHKTMWGSWGSYDEKQFRKDCLRKNVDYPFSDNYYNIKPLFSFALGINKDLGVSSALKHLDIPFEGTPHRGIDDAVSVAKLLKKIFTNESV